MLDYLKHKYAEKVVEKQLKQQHFEQHSFNDFFSKAFTFFIAMPADDRDFTYSLEVLNYLTDNKKSAVVLTKDFKVSLLPQKFRARSIEYSERDITRLKLPSKKLIDRLIEMQFNVSIDLSRSDNLFNSYSSNLVQSPLKVGFAKTGSDKYYNIQIINEEDSPEISYKNFLNCLKMFSGLPQ